MDLPVAVGQVVANKYRVDRYIGAGGMGVVAAGFHLELDHPVAIKFLNAETGLRGDAAERFRREGRAAARIRSEHVVRVLDIGLLNEQVPYMVMELLEGTDLEQELQANGPLAIDVAARYLLQAIDAIAEAHAAGIVHRDLKPTNLFLASTADGGKKIKVLDFGISKSVGDGRPRDAALTKTASMFGSPLYMSPEQMRSARDVDARTDVWALGAILYELVSGQLPFLGESIPALCVAVINEAPQPIAAFLPSVPEELEAIIERCLAKQLDQRFQSVADLAEALLVFAPDARAHAERARRLLSRSEGGPVLSVTPPAPMELRRSYISRAPTASAARLDSIPAAPEATQSSWGRTGGRAMSKRGVPLILGGVVLAALVALLAREWLSPARVGEVTAAIAAPPVESVVQAISAAVPVSAPAPETNGMVRPAEPAASAAPSASAESADVAPSTKQPQVRAPRAAPRAAVGEKPAAGEKRAPGSAAPLTDFGGRYH